MERKLGLESVEGGLPPFAPWAQAGPPPLCLRASCCSVPTAWPGPPRTSIGADLRSKCSSGMLMPLPPLRTAAGGPPCPPRNAAAAFMPVALLGRATEPLACCSACSMLRIDAHLLDAAGEVCQGGAGLPPLLLLLMSVDVGVLGSAGGPSSPATPVDPYCAPLFTLLHNLAPVLFLFFWQCRPCENIPATKPA